AVERCAEELEEAVHRLIRAVDDARAGEIRLEDVRAVLERGEGERPADLDALRADRKREEERGETRAADAATKHRPTSDRSILLRLARCGRAGFRIGYGSGVRYSSTTSSWS